MSTDTEERVKAHPLDAPDTEVSERETFGLNSINLRRLPITSRTSFIVVE